MKLLLTILLAALLCGCNPGLTGEEITYAPEVCKGHDGVKYITKNPSDHSVLVTCNDNVRVQYKLK